MRRAFTLIEWLVVIGVIALLLALLIPGLAAARAQARTAVCGSNIRQLVAANTMYAQEHASRCVPGAADHLLNLNRWHGVRSTVAEPFDSARGPLVPYLGSERAIRDCPGFSEFSSQQTVAFERGCGGYGYNNAYIGVQLRAIQGGSVVESDRAGTILERILRPVETLMFADAAFTSSELIEYSFAEPPFHPTNGQRADPSIHFRHRGKASIAWSDGHVSTEKRTFTWSSGLYAGSADRFGLGWFGSTDDNGYFDLE